MYLTGCVLFVTFCLTTQSNGANILVLMGCPSPSHHLWQGTLTNELAARGHNITVLSSKVDPKAPANVTYVHMDGVYDLLNKEFTTGFVENHNESSVQSVDTMMDYALVSCQGALQSQGVQQLLAYPDDFRVDLILYDFTLGPCLLGFQHKFHDPPTVAVTPFNIPAYTAEVLGGHNYYAYIPFFAVNYDVVMTFWQRFENIYLHAYEYYQRNCYMMPALQKMATTVFGPNLPNLSDLEQRSVLALVNSNPVIDYPEPLPPNVIAIGGMQVRKPKPLPDDIETFIRSSRKAAVLFALGTNVRSDQLGVDKQLALLAAFRRMPEYNFLWKFETDSLPSDAIPPNVLIRSWLPQNDILAHPMVRAFITHSGTMSTHEATWHAVPMVCIPFIVDQVRTSFKSTRDGVAERILFEHLTADLVEQKVRQVLEDPRYQANMDQRSARFRDQPEHPLVRAVWWVEYVLRNPDPQHLQSPVKLIGAFVGNSYDMMLVVLLSGIVLTFVLCKLFMRQTRRERNQVKKQN